MTVLTVESISDIKTKSMSCVRLTIYFLMALLGNLIFGYQSVISMAGGIAIGIIVLIYGLITKEVYVPWNSTWGFTKSQVIIFILNMCNGSRLYLCFGIKKRNENRDSVYSVYIMQLYFYDSIEGIRMRAKGKDRLQPDYFETGYKRTIF